VGAIGIGTAASATSGATAGPSAGATSGETLKLARVWAVGRPEHRLLASFDDTHVVHPDGAVEVLLWPGDLARLQASGLRFQVDVDDLVARDAALPRVGRTVAAQPGETKTGDYRVLADYEADMRSLAQRFPTKAKLIELPHKTLQGRTVYGLEVCTDVNRRDGRPVFYQDGCHHAREWPASEMPLMWVYDLLENPKKDARMKAILDNVRTIIVPVVNVDGFTFTRSFPPVESGEVGGQTNPLPAEAVLLGGQGRYVRKNRRPLLSSQLGVGLGPAQAKPVGADAIGVDPNRNYAYAWGDDEGGSSADGFAQTYRGTDPFSEQETKNVSGLLKSHQVLAMVTNHTSGDLLLWAWGDTRADAPDNALLEGLGRAMATYNGYKPQKSIDLYVTTGTTSDYAYGVLGSIGYTFEHAGSSFHPPYAVTVPAMYAKNREAYLLLASYACLAPEQRPDLKLTAKARGELAEQKLKGGLSHAIVSGRAVDGRGRAVPASLTLTKTFDTLLWAKGAGNPLGQRAYSETISTSMSTGSDGSFAWHVNPSTRPIIAAAKKTESYLLTVTGPDGVGVSRRLVLTRGQRLDLGNVVVG
ncbi:MAG: zinc carboxypeptidase, partial [Frankiales bacterium]|nr:zinc carboxypeptidase [Frankiales bacterium]